MWFFPPCCPVQVLSCALCLHHVFLSEQIKMMMMIYTIPGAGFLVVHALQIFSLLLVFLSTSLIRRHSVNPLCSVFYGSATVDFFCVGDLH